MKLNVRPVLCAACALLLSQPLFGQSLPPSPDHPERVNPPKAAVDPPPDPIGSPGAYSIADPAIDPIGYFRTAYDPSGSGPLPVKQGQQGPEVFSIPMTMNPLLKAYMDTYTSPSGRAWIEIVLKQAEPFLGYIASRIAHYHLPSELLYLPMVESTYNPYAVSYAGAAGLWQLTVGGSYPFNLEINDWLDQRFDFWKATDASLLTLKYDYDVLGNWLLALAAYNAGLNYVKTVVAQTGIHDFWTLAKRGDLPYETMNYVPRFLAIAAVCSYPGRYGLPTSWKKPMEWTRIPLDQSVDIDLLAEEAGVSPYLLNEGNAELRYGVTPPGWSHYQLKVPVSDAATVERVLKQQRFHLMRFYVYRVESGDTLYDLALYYGVPVSMILQYNPGVQAHLLQIGTRLLIPGIKDVPPYQHPVAQAPSTPQMPLSDLLALFSGSYTVQSGDSLWSIANHFGTTPADIARVNGIDERTFIHPGLVLRVPG